MSNKNSLKCIESKRFGRYQVHRRRFFFWCIPLLLLDLGRPVNHGISIFFHLTDNRSIIA